MKAPILEEIRLPYSLARHKAMNLIIDSPSLKGNPLGDPSERHNYILIPNGSWEHLPVVFHLCGYFSTGFQVFSPKTLERNFIEKVDQGVVAKKYPKAIHVFVEATTYLGGSQFINSHGCGNYQDYILKDLYPAIKEAFPVSDKKRENCLLGASSGGYGALNLISQKDTPFGVACAIAPDSFFEASLLPEIWQAAPEIMKYKSFSQLRKFIDKEELQGKKSFFTLANVVAMAHCYSPKTAFKKDFLEFPVDLYTGELNSKIWKEWMKHDPLCFLPKRLRHLGDKELFFDVGRYDNFSLQFGTRQIVGRLKTEKVKCHYSEFSGNHFGLSERRLLMLETLAKRWKKYV